MIELGEIAELRSGVGFPLRLQGRPSGVYPMVKVGDISKAGRSGRSVLTTANHFVDEADLGILKGRPVPSGSVLFAKIGEAIRHNHRVIAGRPVLMDNNAMAAIPKTADVESRYLFRLLQSLDFYALASSTTVPSLRKSRLEQVLVPFPVRDEQRRIAAILDHVDALRSKRLCVLVYLDMLRLAIFNDMFGDVVATSTVGDVAEVQGGLQVSTKRKSLPLEVSYLRVANVHRGRLDLSEVKTLNVTQAELERTALADGDLLFVEGHANPLEVGRVATWADEIAGCVHQNHIIRGRLNREKALPEFASGWLNSPRGAAHFRRAAKTTSGLNTISTSTVRNAPMPLPSIDLQRTFAERVGRVSRQRVAKQRLLTAYDELFASLQSRAFRGEL